jgi:hypothetical protein
MRILPVDDANSDQWSLLVYITVCFSHPHIMLVEILVYQFLSGCDKIGIMKEPSSDLRVQPGFQVELELLTRSGERERLKFDLVPDEQADYQAGFLGVSAPLAQAILGEQAGATVPFFTDELLAVEILDIRESTRTPDTETVAQRDAAIKEARDQIEFTNAVLFAASVDTKWGEYDADGLDYEEWKESQPKSGQEA